MPKSQGVGANNVDATTNINAGSGSNVQSKTTINSITNQRNGNSTPVDIDQSSLGGSAFDDAGNGGAKNRGGVKQTDNAGGALGGGSSNSGNKNLFGDEPFVEGGKLRVGGVKTESSGTGFTGASSDARSRGGADTESGADSGVPGKKSAIPTFSNPAQQNNALNKHRMVAKRALRF